MAKTPTKNDEPKEEAPKKGKDEKAEKKSEDKIEPIEDQGISPRDPYPTSGD